MTALKPACAVNETSAPPMPAEAAAAPVPEAGAGGVGQHNAAIDAMRGIAALMVVLYHMDSFEFPVAPAGLAVLGAMGVNIFFTLSGFLIGRAVLVPRVFDRGRFLRNRCLRILPNYFICCFLMLLLVEPNTLARATPGMLAFDLGAHALLMHGWFSSISASIIGPLWTLSHEWIFYLMMAALGVFVRGRRGWVMPVAMCVLAIAAKYALTAGWWVPSTGPNNPVCRWDQFGLGILGAYFSVRGPAGGRSAGWCWLVLGAGLLLAGSCFLSQYLAAVKMHAVFVAGHTVVRARDFGATFAVQFFRTSSRIVWHPVALSAGTSLLLLAFTCGFRRLDGWLKKTPLPWMGKVSYSTYLYHAAVLLCLSRGLRSAPPGSMFDNHILASLIVLAGVYALSAFCYQFFEQPWLARKSPAPAP